jgi:hypothetical protein
MRDFNPIYVGSGSRAAVRATLALTPLSEASFVVPLAAVTDAG